MLSREGGKEGGHRVSRSAPVPLSKQECSHYPGLMQVLAGNQNRCKNRCCLSHYTIKHVCLSCGTYKELEGSRSLHRACPQHNYSLPLLGGVRRKWAGSGHLVWGYCHYHYLYNNQTSKLNNQRAEREQAFPRGRRVRAKTQCPVLGASVSEWSLSCALKLRMQRLALGI